MLTGTTSYAPAISAISGSIRSVSMLKSAPTGTMYPIFLQEAAVGGGVVGLAALAAVPVKLRLEFRADRQRACYARGDLADQAG